jgi:hypothetical protein
MTLSISPIEPNVVLFFSADCVVSTQLKHESRCNAKASIDNWAPDIAFFYQDFREKMEKKGIHFWKYNGDEILFYVPLKEWEEAKNYTLHFQKLVQEQNKQKTKIHVKGTAWIAGFPVDNLILQTKGSDSIDFIGPDIDLGFRIATLAQKDRIAISPDLAAEIIPLIAIGQKMKWFYYGRKKLKGIPELDGVPVVFISGGTSSLLDEEDALLMKNVDSIGLSSFLNNYLSSTKVCVRKKLYQNIDAAKEDSAYWRRYKKIAAPLAKLHPEYVKGIEESCSVMKKKEGTQLLKDIKLAPSLPARKRTKLTRRR